MRATLATALGLLALLLGPWAPAHADPAPTAVSASATSFRPAPDGIEDTVTLTVTVDQSATSVTLSVDPGVATWTLTPDATTHQVSVVWDGKGAGPDGYAAAGSHTITATAQTPTGPVAAQTSVSVLIETISTSVSGDSAAKWPLVKSIHRPCGKLVMPSAHHWKQSIGFDADATCDRGAKNVAEGLFAARPFGTIQGHVVRDFTTVQVSVYGGAAPGARRRSLAFLQFRDTNGRMLGSPTKLGAHLGWHAAHVVPATSIMFEDNSFSWDIAAFGHAHYDVKAIRLTIGYTYLY